MKNSLSNVQYLLFALLLFALTGCGASGNNTASADLTGSGKLTAKLQWADSKTTAKSVGLVTPPVVAKVRITVTGAEIPTVQSDFGATATSGTVTGVYPGTGLIVAAQAYDSANVLIYEGFVVDQAVVENGTTDVGTITMTPPIVKVQDQGCINCHGASKDVDGQNLVFDYKQSGHYTAMGDILGKGEAGCNGCHTSGPHNKTVNPAVDGKCYACHDATVLNSRHTTSYAVAADNTTADGTKCNVCHNAHNTTKLTGIEAGVWATAGHFEQGSQTNATHSQYGCGRCHNNEGIIQAMAAPDASTNIGTSVTPNQKMYCNTCHLGLAGATQSSPNVRPLSTASATQTSYSSSARGYKGAPGNLWNPNKKPFPDVGSSNICVVCHAGSREVINSTNGVVATLPATTPGGGNAGAMGTSDPYFAVQASDTTAFQKTITQHNLPAAAVMYVKFGFTNLSTGTNGVPTGAYLKTITADLDYVTASSTIGGVTSTHRKLGTAAIVGDTHLNSAGVASFGTSTLAGSLAKNGPCATCHMAGSHSMAIDQKAITTVCNRCHFKEGANDITTIANFNAHFIEPQKEVYNNALTLARAIILEKNANYVASTGTTGTAAAITASSNTSFSAPTGLTLANSANLLGYYSGAVTPTNLASIKFVGALSNIVMFAKDQGGFAHARTYSRRLIYDSLDFLDDGILNMSVGATAVRISALANLGPAGYTVANPLVVGTYGKGTTCYTDSTLATLASGTTESMTFLIGWSRTDGTWAVPQRP